MSASLDLKSLVHEIGPGFAEAADERDRGEIFVAENYETLRERKVFSALVPSELGGGGLPHSQMCAFVRAMAHYCGSTALALSMHQHLVSAAVFNYRNGKPGQKLLEKVAGSEAILVSTGANDWMASNGSAEKVDGGFRISARLQPVRLERIGIVAIGRAFSADICVAGIALYRNTSAPPASRHTTRPSRKPRFWASNTDTRSEQTRTWFSGKPSSAIS